MIIIGIIYGGIVLTLIVQLLVILLEIKKHNTLEYQKKRFLKHNGQTNEVYNENVDINKIVNSAMKAMDALYSGKIKKQLLHNDAPIYDSRDAEKRYVEFLNGSLLAEHISKLENGRYYG